MSEQQERPPAEPVMVSFGPRPTQVLHPETASAVLRLLCRRNRKLFGDLLQQAMIDGDSPDGGRP